MDMTMAEMIEQFSKQLENSISLFENIDIKYSKEEVNNIYISGMGGSGIGGSIIKEIVRPTASVPIEIGNTYHIPAYVSANTLFIASSYSGNTEETVMSVNQAFQKKAKIICITSGGKLEDFAKFHNFTLLKIPGELPSPRACLGYSLVAILFVMIKLGLIGDEMILNLNHAISLIKYDQDEIKNKAIRIAEIIQNKIPIIYTESRFGPVAMRIKQQINENAKMHCWVNVIPEMNHNEIVGWRTNDTDSAVIFLRNKDDFEKNVVRIEFTKKVISNYTDTIIDIYSKGKSLLEKSIYLIHLFDWVSWYLSEFRKVDAIEVNVIDLLKEELKNIG